MSPSTAAPLRSCTVDLTLDLSAPRASRNLVDLLLPQWDVHDPGLLDAAALVVSELVTHALVRSDDGGQITVGIELQREALRMWVLDPSPAVPEQRGPRSGSGDARGLVIVGRIAARWGVESYPGGLRTYADIPLLPVACS